MLPLEEKMQHVTNNTEPNSTSKWISCNSAPLVINNTCSCTFEGHKLIFEQTHLGIGVLVIFSSVRIAHTGFVMHPLEGHLQTIMLYLASVIRRLPEETFQHLFYNITKSLIAHYRNTYRKESWMNGCQEHSVCDLRLKKNLSSPWLHHLSSLNLLTSFIMACKIFIW